MRDGGRKKRSHGYVLGKRNFSAITAVEGLKLSSDGEDRLRKNETLTPAERRAETIRAFAPPATH